MVFFHCGVDGSESIIWKDGVWATCKLHCERVAARRTGGGGATPLPGHHAVKHYHLSFS
eukprot:CAMPEP_0174342984 /NCGR_PEP_ID=MMETSP0810-20121108/26596_1 /TAXON_ID=73025 ORGANISM="Eutreptiella gymnastica-like, Strain CCMP1594" /NCGR_SAMPLE_ID=MMETSP0810 /ASSEMBLY_ACC=CAM_ASM_000659 /LENGTH=58 /DNA_ID=CAMNT_0015465443 /DNA_START=213 /DNA_END=386 /DNA_ORIENTATION=-